MVGGYLGAGKTTLVNHLLRNAGGTRLAVLVNEFGSLPIDADLIEGRDGNVLSISGGCVCCSYGDDLVSGLIDVSNLSPRPDHVLLEASGVALPDRIAANVVLMESYHLDCIVILADTETIADQINDRFTGDTIAAQLSSADIIILNKTDLVPLETQQKRLALMQEVSPDVRVIATAQASVPLALLLGTSEHAEPRTARSLPHHNEEPLYKTRTLTPNGPVDVHALAEKLASKDLGLLRAKGFAKSTDGKMYAIQVVGRRWSVTPEANDKSPGIVMIAPRDNIGWIAIDDLIC